MYQCKQYKSNIFNITLDNEVHRQPLLSSSSVGNTSTFICSYNPGQGIGILQEAGIFNSSHSNSGTMLCRTKFPIINKESGDTLILTWNITAN
mgnify:CR=1 FL=1